MEARKIKDILGSKEMRDVLRLSAQDYNSFTAEPVKSREIHELNKANLKSYKIKDQVLNKKKLIHDRFHPSLYIHQHKKIPIIAKACSNLADLYFKPTCKHFGKIFFNDEKINKNQSYRKRRSEIREAITHKFVQVLIHNLHVGTMVVGMPIKEKERRGSIFENFRFYSIKELAKKAEISEDRAYKIINLLKDYHYIDITEHKIKDISGDYISLNPAISVREGLLLDLGIELQEIKSYQIKDKHLIELMESHKKAKEYFHRERARLKQVNNHMKAMRKTLSEALEKTKIEVKKVENNDKHNDPNFWANFGAINGRLQELNARNAEARDYSNQESFKIQVNAQNEKLLPTRERTLQSEGNDGTKEKSGFSFFDTGRVEIARHVSEDTPQLQLGYWKDREPGRDSIAEARLEKEKKAQEEKAIGDKLKEIMARIKQQHNLNE